MKKRISLIALGSLVLMMMLLAAGCGSNEKFAGDWVGAVSYDTGFFHANYNKLGMETVHIEKNGSGNTYNITFQDYSWSVEDKAREGQPVKLVATSSKDDDTLRIAERSFVFVYNENDKKLHLTDNNGIDVAYTKVKDAKEIDAIKERVSKFVDEHMDEMKQIQSVRDIQLGWEKGPSVTKQQEEDAVNTKKALSNTVENTDFMK